VSVVTALRQRFAEWNFERRLRYHGYAAQAWIRLARRRGAYEILPLDDVRRQRRSDTLFILGSGPSIRAVTPGQWAHVSRHDSFGINFSFLLDFVPTYHLMEDGKVPWHRDLLRTVLAPRRGKLAPTVWFISNRHTRRLIHPRYTPELFPEPARVCVFQMPPRLLLDRDRPFVAADFERAIRYRATMSLVLAIARDLGYVRIVLLGVDPQTPRHFFEPLPEMRPYLEHVSRDQLDDTQMLPLMRPKPGLHRRLDEYLYALNELHFRPRGVSLHVGHAESVLAPRLPYYEAWDR
jgi:hypothetical protein